MATSQQLTPPAPPLGHYDIDVSRTVITFSTRHLFGVGTASFHTGNQLRDRRVRSAGLAGRYLDLSLQVRCVQNSWGGGIADV